MKYFFAILALFFVGKSVDLSAQICAFKQDGTPINTSFEIQTNIPGLPNFNYFSGLDTNCLAGLNGIPISFGAKIRPIKDSYPLNGVDVFDLIPITKHVLNIKPFTSVFQYRAADINNNNNVTTSDIVELRKLILDIYTDFPANTSWRFFQADTLSTQEEYFEYTATSGFNCTFVGVKVGDLTNDALGTQFTQTLAADRSPQIFSIADRQILAGETFEMPIFLKNNADVLAYQFALNFDQTALEIEENQALGTASEAGLMVAKTAENRLAATWFSIAPQRFLAQETPLISWRINALRAGKLSDFIQLETAGLPAKIWAADETSVPISLVFEIQKANFSTQNLTAFPNPFSEKTTLNWSLETDENVALEVTDALGRVVFLQKIAGQKGENQFEISELPTGLFLVKISTSAGVWVRKIMRF